MGKWRRCDDCPRGFPSLTKLDGHRKKDHAFEVLSAHVRWLQGQLAALEAAVRRYRDARLHLESLVPIPPGARELLQRYVNDYDRWWGGGRTKLSVDLDRIPELRGYIEKAREKLRRATMMRPVP